MRYKIIVERPYNVWYRETVQVEADSLEEAKELAKNGEFDDHLDCETIYETETPVQDNYEPMVIYEIPNIEPIWEKY